MIFIDLIQLFSSEFGIEDSFSSCTTNLAAENHYRGEFKSGIYQFIFELVFQKRKGLDKNGTI
jgi:hypothetical protein